MDDFIESAFAPAAEAVATGRISGPTLGVITANGRRAVRVAQGLLDGRGASPAMLRAIRTPVHADRACSWERRFAGCTAAMPARAGRSAKSASPARVCGSTSTAGSSGRC